MGEMTIANEILKKLYEEGKGNLLGEMNNNGRKIKI